MKRRIALVLVSIVVVAGVVAFFFLVPVTSESWFGANPRGPIFRWTALVSPSFYLHGCGMLYDLSVSMNDGPNHAYTHSDRWECWVSRPGQPVPPTYSVPPLSDNVTIQFAQVSGWYNYTIVTNSTAEGLATYAGVTNSSFSMRLTPVFQGETIKISVSQTGPIACWFYGAQAVTAKLYFDGQVVAQGTSHTMCDSAGNIQLSYVI